MWHLSILFKLTENLLEFCCPELDWYCTFKSGISKQKNVWTILVCESTYII